MTYEGGSPVFRFRGSNDRGYGEEGTRDVSVVQEPKKPYDRERRKNHRLRSWGEE